VKESVAPASKARLGRYEGVKVSVVGNGGGRRCTGGRETGGGRRCMSTSLHATTSHSVIFLHHWGWKAIHTPMKREESLSEMLHHGLQVATVGCCH